MNDWHALLSPLPDEAVVTTTAINDSVNPPESSPIAGWRQVTCMLSAGADGLRHLLVVLDATGRPISAADHVLRCRPVEGTPSLTRFEHESIGGRLEEDGLFRGTYHWMVFVRPDDSDEDGPPNESSSRAPTVDEIVKLRSIVGQLVGQAS